MPWNPRLGILNKYFLLITRHSKKKTGKDHDFFMQNVFSQRPKLNQRQAVKYKKKKKIQK